MNTKKITAERILSPTQISIAAYTINPYRGCPFGCLYCYTQENKSIKKRAQPWGEFLDVKINAVTLLEKELKDKRINRVLLGSTVECYPPQEEEFRLTGDIIRILNERNIAVTILTKSPRITRDLQLISQVKSNKIYLTINFHTEETKRIFESFSPPIKERINILQHIKSLDITNRVHIAPVIPFIQDVEALCTMVGAYAQEISVELYNFKMGNWARIEETIRNELPAEVLLKINQTISSKTNYESYVADLKDHIKDISTKIGKEILLFSPDFEDYYRSDVAYE